MKRLSIVLIAVVAGMTVTTSIAADRPGAKPARKERPAWFTRAKVIPAAAEQDVPAEPVRLAPIAPSQSESSAPPATETMVAPAELAEFIGIAEGTNPSLTSASAAIAAAQGIALQQGLYPNPRLDVFSPQLAGSESQYSAQIAQEIVVKGKLRLQRAAAMREVSQAHLAYLRARFDVITEVRQRFYVVLAGQRRVVALEGLMTLLAKSRDTAERVRQIGEGTRTDVLLLEIELQNAEVNLQNARTQLIGARRQLAAAVGQPDMEIGEVHGDLTAPLPDFQPGYAAEILQHTNVLSAAQEIDRTQIRLQRELVEPYPNVTFTAGAQYQVSAPHKQGIFQVSIPLPVWNRNQGNIAAAHANVGKANAAYYAVQNDLTKQLAAALARFRVAQQLVDRYEQKIVPAAKEAQAIMEVGFQQGQFDFLRLLQAQRTVVETQLGYIRAQEDRWSAAAEVANILQLEQFP